MICGHVIYGVGGRRDYACRPVDEQALFRLGADVDRILPLVLVPGEGRLEPEDLLDLPLVDYELVLAHLCAASFGETIGQNVDCAECGKRFSVEFSLSAWVQDVRGAAAAAERAFDDVPFALPTRAILDEAAHTPEALAERLWQGAVPLPPARFGAFEAAVARACPVLADDIEAPCPRCGEIEQKRFVLRRHLASRLRTRLQSLLSDVHVLASSYHWSAADILALPRQTRSALIDTIRLHAQRRRALVPS